MAGRNLQSAYTLADRVALACFATDGLWIWIRHRPITRDELLLNFMSWLGFAALLKFIIWGWNFPRGRHREYLIIYERGKDGGWSAYAPDLPGFGVLGDTRAEAEQLIREGIELHIAGLREDGLPIPEPITTSDHILV